MSSFNSHLTPSNGDPASLDDQPTYAEKNANISSTIPGWKSYVGMLLFSGLGICAAAGQHGFYTYLDKKSLDDMFITQTWVIQIGNAFSFLFKTAFVAAIGIAFCQRFWFSTRRQAIRIETIDSIFDVLRNPIKFANTDFLCNAKLLFIVATISWTLPLSAIFSPGALTGFPVLKHL
jgi:hypothetical protein